MEPKIQDLTAAQQLGYSDKETTHWLQGLGETVPTFENPFLVGLEGNLSKTANPFLAGLGVVDDYSTNTSSNSSYVSNDNYKKLAANIRARESNNNYQAENQYGYIGAYQQGAAMLIDLGIVKKGTTNKGLSDPTNWLKYSKEEYLDNKSIQDSLFEKEIALNTRYLKGNYIDEKDLHGMLAASHLLGAGGAKSRNENKSDANGATFKEYYNIGVSSY